MDQCSQITIGHNTKIVLQHNLSTSLQPCNTIFQLPSLAIHSCILQYNFHVVCLPTILQYNVAIQFPPSLAIQSLATTQPRLQYNFFVLQLNLDYSCNTISWPNQPLAIQLLILQYNFPAAHSFSAIQYSVLQYTFHSSQAFLTIQSHNTIFFTLGCNTIQPYNTNFFFTI